MAKKKPPKRSGRKPRKKLGNSASDWLDKRGGVKAAKKRGQTPPPSPF